MKIRSIQTLFSLMIGFILIFSSVSNAVAASEFKPNIQNEVDPVIRKGFDYLASQMNADGGIRWMDEHSNTATTLRVVLALAAAGYSQDYLQSEPGNRPIDFLASTSREWVNQSETEVQSFSLARAGQLLTAIAAANENPHAFGGDRLDLVYEIKAKYDSSSGIFGNSTSDNVLDQIWAMIGLAANHAFVAPEAADWLVSSQMDDGSWDDGYGSFLDTTPLALMALIASGHKDMNSPEVQAGIDFIRANQQPDGGWQTEWDTTTNANTTGMILQAIAALDQLPLADNWRIGIGNPQTALLTLQQADGSIGGDFANAYSTADAILGLSGHPLYDLGYLRRINRGFEYVISIQDPSGGWGSVGQTIDVMLALNAAGWDPNTVTQNGTTPLSYVIANLEDYLESGPDAIGKSILAAAVSGEDPANLAGFDLVSALLDTYDEETNAFGAADNTWHQALAILGLRAAQTDFPQGAVDTLIQLQQDDGGWEYASGFGTGPDNTALVIQALAAASIPADHETISKALAYIKSMQNENGDWGDSSTTSYVLMALSTLDSSLETWLTEIGKAPLPVLFAYQKSNGSFFFKRDFPDDNLMATSSALLAVLSGNFLVTSPDPGEFNYAGLVVNPGNGEEQTACVAFLSESISGLELLDASGIAHESKDGFMNSLMDVSNPDGGTMYWSYWGWDGREWGFKNSGASDSLVKHSSIETWSFVSWEVFPSLPPEFIPNLNEICGFFILKDYRLQPYLNYKDLVWTKPDTIPDAASAPTTDPIKPLDETGETTPPAQVVPVSEQASEARSIIPVLIIAGVGLVSVAAILIIIMRKRL